MDTVDSKEEVLPFPVVVTRSAQRLIDAGGINLPLQVILIALAKEATLETANVYQAGNTVFIGHISPDKKRMWGRALNMDTPRNLINNALQYLRYINKIGVRDYYTNFNNPSFASAFKFMEKSSIAKYIDLDVYQSKKRPNETIVHIHMNGKIEF
jgi:hypothetical protein